MTYGAEEDAYYVLDRTEGPSVTLYRIGRGNVLDPLGSTIKVPAYRNMDGTTLVIQRDDTPLPLRITPFKTNDFYPENLDVGDGEPELLEQVF